MAENNQQYKWRQRKKRNTWITIWIIFVILAAAAATFVYEGMKSANPLNVAKNYFAQAVGAKDYTVTTGERSLNQQNQFVQNYTFTYTEDGKETSSKLNMVQEDKKKYGLFDQWSVEAAGANAVDLDLIVPAGSQVLINGVQPDASTVKEDDTLTPGAVCYELTSVDPTSTLQVTGLPFDSYEGTLETSGSTLDIRSNLTVSDNAKTQMEEMAKSMINELYTAVAQDTGADNLSALFDHVPNKANLYRAVSGNLFSDGELRVSSMNFEGFNASFGDVYYPGTDEDSYVGMEMTLTYTCKYTSADGTAAETETESETENADTTDTAEETENSGETSAEKEATFYFQYQNGECVATSMEVPSAL